MTSQAQADDPIDGVRGLVFLGFPLHPSAKPSMARAEHLSRIRIPILFVQGTRDKLADLKLLRSVLKRLPSTPTCHVIDGLDHAFHIPARSGRTDLDIVNEVAAAIFNWIGHSKL